MVSLFESILREDKSSRIKKLNIPVETQTSFIEFFKKHSNLESKVDWNKKSEEIVGQITALMQNTDQSRSKTKKRVKSDFSLLWEKVKEEQPEIEFKIWHSDSDFIFVSPLNWECAIFMNSFDCYGTGAKWCIGHESGSTHWDKYVVDNEDSFVMVYCANDKQKYMIQKDIGPNEVAYTLWKWSDVAVVQNKSVDTIFDYIGFDDNPNVVHNPGMSRGELVFIFNNDLQDVFEQARANHPRSIHVVLENVVDRCWDDYPMQLANFRSVEDVIDDIKSDFYAAVHESQWNEHDEMINNEIEEVVYGIAKEFINTVKEEYIETGKLNCSEEYMIDVFRYGLDFQDIEVAKRNWRVYYKEDWDEIRKDKLNELRSGMRESLFESILREKKDHLIKKLDFNDNQTPEMQNEMIEFFNKYSNLESKIDWNKDAHHIWKSFEQLKAETQESRSAKKIKIKQGDLKVPFKDRDDVKVYYSDDNVIFAAPLSWEAAIFMNSHNCFGTGAKWCIGTSTDNGGHWFDFVKRKKSIFLMYYNKEAVINKKLMIECCPNVNDEEPYQGRIWDERDNPIQEFLSTKTLNRFFNIDTDFTKIFKDLHEIMQEKYGDKIDERVALVLKNKDYLKTIFGKAFELFILEFWNQADNWEQRFGGNYDLTFNRSDANFTLNTSHSHIVINESLSKTEIDAPHLYNLIFKYSLQHLYECRKTELEGYGKPGNYAHQSSSLIKTINCPTVTIANFDSNDYNEEHNSAEHYPYEINGNLHFINCVFKHNDVSSLLPRAVNGKITFENCRMRTDFIDYYKDYLVHQNEVELENCYTNLLSNRMESQIQEMYEIFIEGKVKENWDSEYETVRRREISMGKITRIGAQQEKQIKEIVIRNFAERYANYFITEKKYPKIHAFTVEQKLVELINETMDVSS